MILWLGVKNAHQNAIVKMRLVANKYASPILFIIVRVIFCVSSNDFLLATVIVAGTG
jgi:hypothetical protein